MLHALAAGFPYARHDGAALRDQCVGLGDVFAGQSVEIADVAATATVNLPVLVARWRAAAVADSPRAREGDVQIARILAKRLTECGNHAGQRVIGQRTEMAPGGKIAIDGEDLGLGGGGESTPGLRARGGTAPEGGVILKIR